MELSRAISGYNWLKPAERLMLSIAVFTAIINGIVVFLKGADIDYLAYGLLSSMIFALMALGLAYRISGRSERIASALLCASIFLFFSMCASLYNYLLLPIVREPIDPMILQLDALVGFHWPDVMHWAAQNPTITTIMKFAYVSTIPQFALLVVVLGLGGRMLDLHILLTSVAITATLTICFWGLFPSLGAKSVYQLPPEIWQAVNPIVDREYAIDLVKIATFGPGEISPKEIRGLIAFPSYHAVLAFTAIWAARNVPVLGRVFLLINLIIMPATFIHGGHHLADLPAGFAMFLIGTVLATRVVTSDFRRRSEPAITMAG